LLTDNYSDCAFHVEGTGGLLRRILRRTT